VVMSTEIIDHQMQTRRLRIVVPQREIGSRVRGLEVDNSL